MIVIGLCLAVVASGILASPAILKLVHVTAEGFVVRIPIIINGDSDFIPLNGVVGGSGTSIDPFIISGWEVQLGSGAGISVSNTAAHFIISEVHVNSTASASGTTYGVYFHNVTNGQVRNSLLNNTQFGVHVDSSQFCSIHHNVIYACNRMAVEMTSCSSVHVVGNTVRAANGVMATTLANSVVSLNSFNSSEMAINLADASFCTVQQNSMNLCTYAVSLSGSHDISVTGNNATNGYYGFVLSTCWNVNMSGNEAFSCDASGLYTTGDSTAVVLIYNVVRNSLYSGCMIDGATNMIVRDNLLMNNTFIFPYTGGGVTVTLGAGLMFYHNNFVANTYNQAQDPYGFENMWNGTYPLGGNYWSDYVGLDTKSGPLQNQPGSDGFGDTPYVIDADSIDFYPLMAMNHINARPDATFSVTPPSGSTGQTMHFDASGSSDPDEGFGDSITSFRWDFDGDGVWDTLPLTDGKLNHQYLAPGNYTAIVEVTDSYGLSSLYSVQVSITGAAIPEFGTVLLPVIGLMAVFAWAASFSRRKPGLN